MSNIIASRLYHRARLLNLELLISLAEIMVLNSSRQLDGRRFKFSIEKVFGHRVWYDFHILSHKAYVFEYAQGGL